MTKIEILTAGTPSSVAEIVNNWLEDNESSITIEKIALIIDPIRKEYLILIQYSL